MAAKRWAIFLLAMAASGAAGNGLRADTRSGPSTYEAGARKFQSGDLLGAARDLASLAPFEGETGARARYLLGRIHEKSREDPEALADFKAVLAWWDTQKAGNLKMPEYVERAGFCAGVIVAEQGNAVDAINRLRTFAGDRSADLKTPLGAEAVLRIGHLQLDARQYPEAIKTLEPLKADPHWGDQALWFTARARILGAPTDTPQNHDSAIKVGAGELKLAAEKVAVLAHSGDASAMVRQLDELLELGDAQVALKDFAAAADTYAAIEKSVPSSPPAHSENVAGLADFQERLQEACSRRVMALELAGNYSECEALAARFQKDWPGSLLAAGVRFREAQSIYLRASAAAAKDKPQLEEACQKFAALTTDFPEYEYISDARFDWATALYRMQRYAEAAEVLKDIPGADRSGELATVPLMRGDCLLRTLPAEGDDALSCARMLVHAERAAGEFSQFVLANPSHPQMPLAQFKLGYCYERIAGVLAENGGERWKTWQEARACYDKLLAVVRPESPLGAEAIFERAKVLMSIGDWTSATNELRRFQSDPLAKTEQTPLALLRLSMMLRGQGKGQEAADMLAKWRSAHVKELAGDSTRAGLIPMLQYEQAVALKEGGKWAEARPMFAELAKQQPATAEAMSSQWRLAQGDREAIAARLIEARRRVAATANLPPKRGAEKQAAATELQAAIAAMRDWVGATSNPAKEALKTGGEGAVRLSYELAWGYRALGEGDVEMAREQNAGLNVARLVSASVGDSTSVPAAGEIITDAVLDWIPLQPTEIDAENAYRGAIAAGDNGGMAEQDTANLARQDLGEMLAQRGLVDQAMDLFAEEMEHGLSLRDAARPRLRIAECLLAKKQPQAALEEINLSIRGGGRIAGEIRYVGAEAYAEMKNWTKVVDTLRPFEDNSYYPGEFGDRAYMRLADTLVQEHCGVEARDVYDILVKKYPRSPLAKQARLKSELCVIEALVSVPKPQSRKH